jgi:hypothetical protein
MDAMVKRKIPSPCRGSNMRSSSPQPSQNYTTKLSLFIIYVIQ